jgi:hypothetical protein
LQNIKETGEQVFSAFPPNSLSLSFMPG